MITNGLLEYYLDGDLEEVKQSLIFLVKYARKANCKIKNFDEKLKTLNYFIADEKDYVYKRRHGKVDYFNMRDCGAICLPFLDYNDNLEDVVIIINESYKDNPLYKMHELLHFVSMKNNDRGEFLCGIQDFSLINSISQAGRIAINEGITDFFAYKICGKYYNEKYLNFMDLDQLSHKYYYSTLLINLFVYNDKIAENKLFNAYIQNDVDYIYSELCKSFGLNKTELENLFERAEVYSLDIEDKVGLEIFREDIKRVIKHYYYNVYRKKRSDVKFIDRYLNRFLDCDIIPGQGGN